MKEIYKVQLLWSTQINTQEYVRSSLLLCKDNFEYLEEWISNLEFKYSIDKLIEANYCMINKVAVKFLKFSTA